jgi:FAD/FMN-containing dehydrogenase
VKGSKALLGDPVDVCKFEIIFSGNDAADVRHARALTAAYDAALRARFGDAVHFHFGQLVPDDRSGPPAGYPGLERFRQVQREFDPSGRMLNDWQRSLFPQA